MWLFHIAAVPDDLGVFHSVIDIPEPPFGSRGNGSTQWKTGLMFYNPNDLAAVASGTMLPHEPKAYAVFDLDQFSMKEVGGDGVAGAIAFDSENKYLYFIEHNGDPGYEWGYSMIHVWKLVPASQPSSISDHAWKLH